MGYYEILGSTCRWRIYDEPKAGIVIPNNFEHEKEVVFVEDDLSDLVELGKYYLKHKDKREEIAKNGLEKMLAYHTDLKRAEYIFETMDGFNKNAE